jgi:hypothetical protein
LNAVWHRSREQVDFVRAAVSKESRSLCQVIDALRKEAHQPGASEIRCHGIISQNDAVLLNSGFFLPHDDFPQAAVGS